VTYAVIYFFPVGKTAMKAILLVAMTIFAVFVAYDTNLLLAPGAPTGPDAVLNAAIGFYLDIVNLFSEAVAYTDLSE
jgi:FtsH-binding integral membrane protein